DTLKTYAKQPIVAKILDYRGLVKLLNTYAEALPKLVNRATGRLHTSFNQTVVITGRLSSSNPNLQNIPIRDENGKEIRKAFVAGEEGHLIVAADYSQVELRLMAHLSGDENLIEAFKRGDDIHAATAAKVFAVPFDEVTKDMRRKAKTANFGIIYGISAFGLAERLGISRSDAKKLIDDYFVSFPSVHNYMNESIKQARERGYVETLFGRRRDLPDINSRNPTVRGTAERFAINAPIQGSAADIMKIAMINVFKALKENNLKAKMMLQVHDELVFDCPANEVEQLSEIVKREMENAYTLRVPLIAEVGVGDNWLEAH
ncbi:MAG: DNA polymerase I, partial [Bacteroidales bacterium]|nr:DNA polymerase I [Bacteroidales bacterium]